MSGIDSVLLFDAAFTTTNPIETTFATIRESFGGVTIFVDAVGVAVDVEIQVQDPLEEWHTVDSDTVLIDTTDALAVACNPGRVRVVLTPAAGSGSARVWTVPFGG